MRVSTILYLYRVRLRARLVQELLAVVGIAVGVALLFASQIANTSLTGSVTRLANELVGTARLQLAARDPHGFSDLLLTEVERLPGVMLAAPILERSVNVVGPGGAETVDLIGVNARFIQLKGRLLARVSTGQLSEQNGLALPAPITEKIGVSSLQPVTVQVGARNVRAQLSIRLESSDIGTGVASPVAIMPLAAAQKLTDMRGRITHILIEPSATRDHQVQAELERIAAGDLNVRPANFDAQVFHQAEGPTVQSTQLFSTISALVGFLFAFNAMLLTVPQRRNLITDLRLDGYTPLEIVKVLAFDVLALGIAGTGIGLVLGQLLSRSLLRAQPGYLSLAFPVGSLHIVNWQSVAVAAVGGLLAALVGVFVPLRREILGPRPAGSQAAKVSNRVRSIAALLGGTACMVLTTVLLLRGFATVGEALIAFSSLTIALLLILPVAFSAMVVTADRLQRPMMGVSSRIALIELLSRTTRARSLAIAATGAIAVFGSVSIEGAHSNLRDGLARAASEISLGTDLWVSPLGRSTTLATIPFENRYRRVLEALSNVRKLSLYRGGFLDVADRRVLVLAPPRANPGLVPAGQVVAGNVTLARTHLREKGWLTMSQELARELHLKAGDSFILPAPRPTRFRVAALTTNFGWSPGAIIMNADDYALAWASSDLSAYQIMLKPGIPMSVGLREVQNVLRPGTALVAQSATRHEQNEIAGQRQGLARLTGIAALVLVAAALAMAAAMAAMIWQRRPRLAGMKVDGFEEGELWGALVWESVILLGTGCSIGAAFGLYGQLVLSHALVNVTGFPVVFSIGISVAAVSLALVTTISIAVVALPGYMAVQVKPALQD